VQFSVLQDSENWLLTTGGKYAYSTKFFRACGLFELNAAPAPMLDLAGALAFQVVSTAVHLNVFNTLHEKPSTLPELTQTLSCQQRGLQKLLAALTSLGYVTEKNGRYHISPMTEKWFLDGAAVVAWVVLRQITSSLPENPQKSDF
jgi:hypothetical protein